MSGTKLSFGFKKAALSAKAAPPVKAPKPPAFADGDDDEEVNAGGGGPFTSSSAKASGKGKSKLASVSTPTSGSPAPLSKTERQKQKEALEVDSTAFKYDEVYDQMKTVERKREEARKEEAKERKPKYIANFFAAAEQRKSDRLRAEAKLIQREREAEGDEFADKEQFVTDAYRKQQEELKKAEEEEEKREAQQRIKNRGVAAFYRNLMEKAAEEHDAAVAATLEKPIEAGAGVSPGPSGKISRPVQGPASRGPSTSDEKEGGAGGDEQVASDLKLADEARKRGLTVELNDDNQIVDRRDLLVAGLNFTAQGKNVFAERAKARAEAAAKERAEREAEDARGTGGPGAGMGYANSRAAKEESRARQSRLIEEQMIELERKRAREEEEEHRRGKEKLERRNKEEDVRSARERYLERKKKAEEERKRKEQERAELLADIEMASS